MVVMKVSGLGVSEVSSSSSTRRWTRRDDGVGGGCRHVVGRVEMVVMEVSGGVIVIIDGPLDTSR